MKNHKTDVTNLQPLPSDTRALAVPATLRSAAAKSLVCVRHSPRHWGMGFVTEDIYGRRIVTAAHCVPIPEAPGVGNVDALVGVTAFPSRRKPLLAALVAWEPCADVAVLDLESLAGSMSPDYEALDALLSARTPAPICRDLTKLGDRFAVHVCQHTGEWTSGKVRVFRRLTAPACIHAEFDQPILGGTSGSPAFTDAGLVVGVVSTIQTVGRRPTGKAQLACLAGALPGWILVRMTEDPRGRRRSRLSALARRRLRNAGVKL